MLIAFDMDGTLVEGNSWARINKHFGVEEKALKYMNDYLRGVISYREFMNNVIRLWGNNVHIKDIERILERYKLMPGAEEVISSLRSHGFTVAIITVGLDILANKIADKLGISHVIANGVETDENGYLTGNGICRVELGHKDKALIKLAEKLDIPLSKTIAVGDSKYDKSMLEVSGFGIAYNAEPELAEIADACINDLREILNYIKKI